ncbi:MAG: endonuclease/exonuclease/phosphatase family protein [Thermoanaerobaculia bacterium]
MSYNIKGPGSLFRDRHLEEIASVIQQAKPDVVGIQELHRKTLHARYRDQLAELESKTGMRACFGRSLLRKRGEYGNAILVRGEITESEVLPLPGKGEPRTVLRAALQIGSIAIDVRAQLSS